MIERFNADVKEFRRWAVAYSGSDQGSNQRLSQPLERARQALDQAEDDLQPWGRH